MRNLLCALAALLLFVTNVLPLDLTISSFDTTGNFSWTNSFTNGVCTVEGASTLDSVHGADWHPVLNCYTTATAGQGKLPSGDTNRFYRLLAVDVSTNTAAGYSNLLSSYGLIHTIAGNGFGGVDGTNYWQPEFEGGYATNAALSRPHFAMADDAGNVFIVDKDSHSVLKVTPDGLIHTAAGTHVSGNGPDYETNATQVQLSFPNGIWVRGDGTVYVLDTGNNKVRRLDTNGMMTTLFTVSSGISTGRGLWVSDDESITYFSSGKEVRKRVPGAITTLNNNFNDLGNLIVNADGDVLATDRGANKVYLVDATGAKVGGRTRLYGDGSTNAVVEGTLASTNGLYGVRGIWPVPTGGFLLATHEGCQVIYVDPAGIAPIFVNGNTGNVHTGDGDWFHSPGDKVSEVRAVSMDKKGNIFITENDFGFVRRIDFLRLAP